MTKKQPLLSQFLGDLVLIFLSGLDSDVATEDGPMSMPMVLQGIIIDIDDKFLLLGDESNGGFTLVSLNSICKIDTVQEEAVVKPDVSGMN